MFLEHVSAILQRARRAKWPLTSTGISLTLTDERAMHLAYEPALAKNPIVCEPRTSAIHLPIGTNVFAQVNQVLKPATVSSATGAPVTRAGPPASCLMLESK